MSQILNKIRDVDPDNSDAVKDALSSFFGNLNKHTNVDCNKWLRALEGVINRFPRFCGSHRNTIETYLSTFIDSSNYYNVIEAAKCAHSLQQVRPPQEKTATAKSSWKDHVVALCYAAHKLIGSMFPNSVDIYKGNSKKPELQTSPINAALVQILSVPKTPNNTINKQSLLGIRLRNVLVYLQAALVEVYPVAKPIQPQLIIEVIVRALSVSSGVKQPQDIAKAVAVKIEALRTLDALVATLGSNLIPFSSLIFKFVILTLKWCSDNLTEETSEVRRYAYDTLRRWLCTLHAHRLCDSARGRDWEASLAQSVVADVTPPRHLVQLTMRPQSTRHLSKKAKRKQTNAMLQESSIGAQQDKAPLSKESNDEIAVAALEFAETFIDVCGVFMKPTTYVLLLEHLIRECYNIDAYAPPRALGLLRAVDALRKASPSTVPPPTQHCLQLYSVLATHTVPEISKFCSEALLNIRLHLHCSPQTLNYAMEAPMAAQKQTQRKLSSKNRAALEAFLGTERAARSLTEEVIELDDEPSSKKPRIDPEGENISVSSESTLGDESDDEVEEVTAADVDMEGNDDDVVAVEETSPLKETIKPSNTAEESQIVVIEDKVNENKPNDSKENKSDADQDALDGLAPSQEVLMNGYDKLQDSKTSEYEESNSRLLASSEQNMETDQSTLENELTQFPNIHEVKTQMPINASAESDGPRSPRSNDVEVAYDFPNTGASKVTIIERTEDDNLPSTNDTDDVPITCGQVVKSSQEIDIDKNKEAENKENQEPKVNEPSKDNIVESATDKMAAIKDVSVEDMLADFVDEVVDENKT